MTIRNKRPPVDAIYLKPSERIAAGERLLASVSSVLPPKPTTLPANAPQRPVTVAPSPKIAPPRTAADVAPSKGEIVDLGVYEGANNIQKALAYLKSKDPKLDTTTAEAVAAAKKLLAENTIVGGVDEKEPVMIEGPKGAVAAPYGMSARGGGDARPVLDVRAVPGINATDRVATFVMEKNPGIDRAEAFRMTHRLLRSHRVLT